MIHAIRRTIAVNNAIAVPIRSDSAGDRTGADRRRGRDRFISRRRAGAQTERSSAEKSQKPDVHILSLGATRTVRRLDVGTAECSGSVTTDALNRIHYRLEMTVERA
jgi:hypothetical protein